MAGENTPRLPRLRQQVAARFGTEREPQAAGVTLNISSRGLGIAAPRVPPPGTQLWVDLDLRPEQLSRVSGVVTWSKPDPSATPGPGTMGVRIDSAEPSFFSFLSRADEPGMAAGDGPARITPPPPASLRPPGPSTLPGRLAGPSEAPVVLARPLAPLHPRDVGHEPVRRPAPGRRSSAGSAPRPFMAEAPSERKPRPATPVALAEPVPVSPLGHLPSFLEPPEAPDPVAQVVRLKPRGDSTPIIGAREGGDSDASTEKIEKMWEPPEEDVPLSGLSMIETAPGPEEDADRPHAGRPGDWWHHPDTKTALKEVPRGTRIERSPRFFEQMPIRFGATPQLERRGFTENMSRTGLGISCDAPLAPGEVVLFSLALPDDRRCHGVGRVVWSLPGSGSPGDPPLMGIQLERTGSGYGDLLALLASRH